MESLGTRIKHYRLKLGLSQAQLGALCGWESGQGRIGNYERDTREPVLEDIEKIATALSVPASILLGTDSPNPENLSQLCAVIPPLHANGPSAYISRQELSAMGVLERNLRCASVDDSGMAPTLMQGHRVVIDISKITLQNHAISALRHDDGIVFRRFQQTVSGRWILRCDNTDKMIFPDESLLPEDVSALQIVGQVVWSSGPRV